MSASSQPEQGASVNTEPLDLECHICQEIRARKPWYKGGEVLPEACLLCSHIFCETHKNQQGVNGVCEYNHNTYVRNHPGERAFPSLEARNRAILAGELSG